MSHLSRPPDWTERAACAGMTGRGFDPWAPDDDLPVEAQSYNHHLARTICSRCPVRWECAIDALEDLPRNEPHAVRGGLPPGELVDLAKSLGMRWRREAQHGTRSRYVAGCRCEDCRAAHRVYEHDRRLWAKTRRRTITRVDVYAWLTRPHGRGKYVALPGQLLLFTDGLPPSHHETSDTDAQEGAA